MHRKRLMMRDSSRALVVEHGLKRNRLLTDPSSLARTLARLLPEQGRGGRSHWMSTENHCCS